MQNPINWACPNALIGQALTTFLDYAAGMQQGVLIFHIRTAPLWAAGGILAVFGILLSPFVLLMLRPPFDAMTSLLLLGFAGLVALSVYGLGLALARPVALRVDSDGISGYFAPNLRWEQIERIEARRVYKGALVGIFLKDPEGYLHSLGTWGRLRYALRKRPYHTTVNASHMRGDVQDVVAAMERFLP